MPEQVSSRRSPWVGRLGGIASLLAAVVFGLLVALGACVIVASITGRRPLALLVGAIVLAVGTWAAARSPARGISRGGRAGVLTSGTVSVAMVAGASLAWVLALSPLPASEPRGGVTDWWELPDGTRLAYHHHPARGPADPIPVVLLHGGPGSSSGPSTDALGEALAATGLDVYPYDQRGAGRSSRSDDVTTYTVARHVADLEAVRERVGAPRMHLVGTSWGAQLIAAYLAAHPESIARAVMVSPGPLWSPAFREAGRLTEGGAADQAATLTGHPRFLLAHALLSVAGPGATSTLLPDESVDGALEAMVGDLDMWAGCPDRDAPDIDYGPHAAGFWVNAMTTRDAGAGPDIRPVLRTVRAPVLVLRGECDYLAWEVTREYRDTFPEATLVPVDDAGHGLLEDQPILVHDLVARFLSGRPIGPGYEGVEDPWAAIVG